MIKVLEDAACEFIEKLRSSNSILVVVGAGLSRPSGIPTFRNDSWFWERQVGVSASPKALKDDPFYVWAFYEQLRHIAYRATPNSGHKALARLAKAKPNLFTISQSIDGMSNLSLHGRVLILE